MLPGWRFFSCQKTNRLTDKREERGGFAVQGHVRDAVQGTSGAGSAGFWAALGWRRFDSSEKFSSDDTFSEREKEETAALRPAGWVWWQPPVI